MDDLLDLDFTSASSPASGPSGSTSRPPYSTGGLSTFDYLSQARTSPAPSSRAGSPYSTPPVSQPGSKAAAGGGRGGGGGDAFSSLFGGGASVKGPEEELSIAERIARDRGQSRAANANANGHGATTGPKNAGQGQDPWDFDLLAAAPRPGPTPSPKPTMQAPVVDSFDILGLLAQPAPAPSSLHQPRTRSPAPSASPPPHILGQIVEMGFSPAQAHAALDATVQPSGAWNVQRALEVLIHQSAPDEPAIGSTERDAREDSDEEGMPTFRRDYDDDDEERPAPRRSQPAAPATGRRARETAAAAATRPAPTGRRAREAAAAEAALVQDTAAELLAQASKIGFSVFKSANAYWETGRATIQKKLDDSRAESPAEGAAGRGGRPKWMTDDGPVDQEPRRSDRREPERTAASFQDSDDEVDQVLPPRPTRAQAPAPEPAVAEYRSPWRRPKPSASPSPPASHTPPAPAAVRPAPTVRPAPAPAPASAPPRPTRPSPPVSATQLATFTAHREAGNAQFKLGLFSDASASYSLAISSLPALSPLLIPLYTNRASCHLKTGSEPLAADDCTSALVLLLGSRSVPAQLDLTALSPSSVSHLAKALSKRARALEATENWAAATSDWQALRSGGEPLVRAAGGAKLVSEALERCRAVLAPPPPSRATPKQVVQVVQGSGAAVAALREAAESAERDDELRLALKDEVDQRIGAWKDGKEANLRALIGSLDKVLWPELGWVKVGMHELVSEAQVKARYVRAIAKVHPDKLSVGSTTVEQRMVGGSVFAALNEAWNANK